MEKAKVIHILSDGTEVKSLTGIKVAVPESILEILQSCDRKEHAV